MNGASEERLESPNVEPPRRVATASTLRTHTVVNVEPPRRGATASTFGAS